MNTAVKSTLIATLLVLFTAFATNGKAFIESATAAWLFLLKLTADAPLGLSSFLLALSLGAAAQPFVRRYLVVRCPHSRDFIADSAALALAVVVMWVQLRNLDALLLGLLAGFMAPWVYRGIAAGCGLIARRFAKETP